MKTIMTLIAVMGLAACGSQERGQTQVGDVGAAPPATDAEGMPMEEETGAGEDVAASCLAFVQTGRFAEAIALCEEAAVQDPDNAEIASALATAQSRAETGAAAADAIEDPEAAEIESGMENLGEAQAP